VFLVDTSVFTRILKPSVTTALEPLSQFDLVYSSVTGLEIRFSARNAVEWDVLSEALASYRREVVTPDDFDRADTVQRSLASVGLKGRKPADLLIAAQAERLGLTVLHYDRDFEFISSVTQQPHRWVVPSGTVD
jgi:predicted nucleic acid-binding protein